MILKLYSAHLSYIDKGCLFFVLDRASIDRVGEAFSRAGADKPPRSTLKVRLPRIFKKIPPDIAKLVGLDIHVTLKGHAIQFTDAAGTQVNSISFELQQYEIPSHYELSP